MLAILKDITAKSRSFPVNSATGQVKLAPITVGQWGATSLNFFSVFFCRKLRNFLRSIKKRRTAGCYQEHCTFFSLPFFS